MIKWVSCLYILALISCGGDSDIIEYEYTLRFENILDYDHHTQSTLSSGFPFDKVLDIQDYDLKIYNDHNELVDHQVVNIDEDFSFFSDDAFICKVDKSFDYNLPIRNYVVTGEENIYASLSPIEITLENRSFSCIAVSTFLVEEVYVNETILLPVIESDTQNQTFFYTFAEPNVRIDVKIIDINGDIHDFTIRRSDMIANTIHLFTASTGFSASPDEIVDLQFVNQLLSF